MASSKAAFTGHLQNQLRDIQAQGLFKQERVITTSQHPHIKVQGGGGEKSVLNFCANNYLGLANHSSLIQAAEAALESHGIGMASVRFICGTQDLHQELERRLAQFLGMEDCILYPSAFDANGGLFETLLGEEDAVISDALNHASIIDGIRLCKAKRFRYANNDMTELEARLKEAEGARFKLIATDGVFSMDGIIADLEKICDLAVRYGALVMVDDCHATGFLGKNGRGSHEYRNVMNRIDIITGTLGKALGGASGGFTAASKEIVGFLRQRSRPYLFSNAVAPPLVAAAIAALDVVEKDGIRLREQLQKNAQQFRDGMTKLGFTLVPGEHPIIPVMLGDAKLAQDMAAALLDEGIYVVGFFYPVVPMGKARIRTQMSAAHTAQDVMRAVDAFGKVGKQLKIIQ
ncbi:MAG: glycine C-acetyltransferase [Dongiaceae bacterium]